MQYAHIVGKYNLFALAAKQAKKQRVSKTCIIISLRYRFQCLWITWWKLSQPFSILYLLKYSFKDASFLIFRVFLLWFFMIVSLITADRWPCWVWKITLTTFFFHWKLKTITFRTCPIRSYLVCFYQPINNCLQYINTSVTLLFIQLKCSVRKI